MNKLVKSLYVAALLGMVSSVAACGGNKESGDSSKVAFEVWTTFGDKIEKTMNDKIEAFAKLVKEHDGVEVTITQVYKGAYKDLPSKIAPAMSDGSLPAMAVAYPDHVAKYLYDEGNDHGKYIVNLDNFINDPEVGFGKEAWLGDTEGVEDIIETFLNEGKSFTREGTYVLPFMKSSEIMMYNLDAATKAMKFYDATVEAGKVEEKIASMSWNELLAFAEVAYEHKSEVLSSVEDVIFYDSDSNMIITQMYQENYKYSSIGADGKGVVEFDSGEDYNHVLGLLDSYKEAHDKHLLTTKGTEGTYASDSFKNGKCLFTIGSSGGAGYTIPSKGNFNAAVTHVPARNNKPYYVSQGPSWTLFNNPSLSKAENDKIVKYAWKFAKYLLTTEVNTDCCVLGSEGYVPVRESSYTTETYAEFIENGEMYAETAKVLQNDIKGKYIVTATFPGSDTLRDQIGGCVGSLLSGKGTSKALLDAAIQTIKANIK